MSILSAAAVGPGRSDRGDIVLGWLLKLTLVLTTCGVLGFDAVSVAGAGVSIEDQARSAAIAAREAHRQSGTVQAAYQAALDRAHQDDRRNQLPAEKFLVTADSSVSLEVRREARTILLRHLPKLRNWAVVSATAHTARPLG